MNEFSFLCAAAAMCCADAALGQASFTASGYAQSFDSMGAAGTAPPTGWRHFPANFGTNSTWTASIPATGADSAATMPVGTTGTTLTATTTPAANNNNGFNAARSAAATADRVLATAPTATAGVFIQLQLRNDTGADLSAGSLVTLAFDTVRYTSVGTPNQLPGYWVFASLDGTTWGSAAPNPTIATIPNTTGITFGATVTYTLDSAWTNGASIHFRWADDNAAQTSPDQIVGLNNVVISAVAPILDGRCCFPDGSCITTNTGSCATSATFTPEGACAPNTCPILDASLPAAGYSQSFDALGPTGTALPTGFSMWTVAGDRPTFDEIANGGLGVIPTSAVSTATIVSPPGALAVYDQVAANTPATRNAGYNFGFSSAPANRLLGLSPTGNAASFIQFRFRNDTGASVSALSFQYTFRVISPWAIDELSGYRFFCGLSGPTGAYFAVPALDGLATGTDATGASFVKSAIISLSPSVPADGEVIVRWGDDNSHAAPDQAYAIDDVSIAVIDPSTLGACCAGDGSCSLLADDDECIGGIFRGIGTACATADCPQPPGGSCCAIDGSCAVTTQAACSALWTLDGTCTPNLCPGPLSACCATDGSCSLLPQAQCSGFSSPGTCTPALCRQPGDTRFAAFGDYGIDGGNQPAVAARMKTFNPEFLTTTGDNTYFTSTNISNYDNTQAKYYREFIKITNPASAYFGQGAPVNNFFPIMGNHDMDIGGGAAAAIPYWNAYWELPGNERYYTFSRGPIDFFMLSSDSREPDSRNVGGTQYTWFVNAYNASTAKFKIVQFHHPAQTSVSAHGPDLNLRAWNFQSLAGITAVLAGHNHNLERLEFGGIPWFVTGAGGNSLYTISSIDPNSVFRNDTQWGFLLVDANSAGITFRFINAAGQILDTRTIICPGACCTPAGACSLAANAAACTASFLGAGTACAPNPCPQPTGACCIDTTCSITTSGACSGIFQGIGSVCGLPGNPTTCCPALQRPGRPQRPGHLRLPRLLLCR